MRGPVTSAFWVLAMTAGRAVWAEPVPPVTPVLDVCLVASPGLSLTHRERGVALTEANAIWNPIGVSLRWTEPADEHCDRKLLVKADTEALPRDAADEAALGWVVFVEGRARQLVFLRLDRGRRLIAAVNPGLRPPEIDSLLFAKFIGRGLAHEVGHVLLNSRTHASSGLMRARYRPDDVLSAPAQSYTLAAAERLALFARIDGELRLTAR